MPNALPIPEIATPPYKSAQISFSREIELKNFAIYLNTS